MAKGRDATDWVASERRTGERTWSEASTSVPRWRTVVWDDPVNLMSYVTAVFREYFGYSTSRAEELMMAVHTRGRATVSTGVRERVEADVMAMHSYGLHATIEEDRD